MAGWNKGSDFEEETEFFMELSEVVWALHWSLT